MTTGSAAGAGVFTFGSTTSARCSGSFSSSGSTVFTGAGAMATGTGAGVATGAAVGACFGQSSGVAMAAIMTAATGSNHRGSDVFLHGRRCGLWRRGVHAHRLWRIQFIFGDTDGSHRRDKRRVGMLKGHYRGRFLLLFRFRLVNHHWLRFRDQRFAQAVQHVVARVLVKIDETPEADHRFAIHQKTKFSPGN